jgi:starch phosphorylase
MPATARRSARRPARRADAPSTLDRVEAIARNLWWTWHLPAKRLIESLDPALYHAANNNPIATIRRLSPTRRDFLNSDAAFADRVASVERDWHHYMTARSWFDRTAKGAEKKAKIAYFCMEFAVQECLPLYAGGLGVLAGDHLKSASDLGVPLVAVGILWRKGYYRQEITADGSTRVLYPASDFDELPVHDTGVTFRVTLGKHTPLVKIWRMDVGRVPVYLMDTDLPENPPKVRRFTHHLYAGGDPEYRIQQEMLLGVGGLAALDAMGVEPTVLHLNEGHAAFCGMERVRRLREKNYSIERAIKAVRASTVFTTHTPVPEGNDRFDAKAVWPYIGPIAEAAGLDRERALGWGREDPTDKKEQFCMTVLALKLAEHCNGVAELHGDTARKMWLRTYGASDPKRVPIGHVTNGVHPPTWISDDAHDFYAKHLKPRWVGAGPDADPWANAEKIPAEELWHLRNRLRRRLIGFLRERIREQVLYHEGGDAQLASYYDELRDDALTIGFARRFATYKRAPLMFSQPNKLAELLGDPARPVQILFAGKAHPMDDAGKAFVQKVWQMSRRPEFRGKIFLLQNYDMEIGRMLTQGCDLWLNNPVRPMEASGTSGMKCPLNAGLNCSILDGWWPEGYDGKNGFSLGGEQFKDRAKQDRHDAARIYEVLGGEVIPEFYRRGRDGVPRAWCKRVARAMRTQCAQFSTHRMVAEYLEGYYLPAHASR